MPHLETTALSTDSDGKFANKMNRDSSDFMWFPPGFNLDRHHSIIHFSWSDLQNHAKTNRCSAPLLRAGLIINFHKNFITSD
jgi:hypothetical protein